MCGSSVVQRTQAAREEVTIYCGVVFGKFPLMMEPTQCDQDPLTNQQAAEEGSRGAEGSCVVPMSYGYARQSQALGKLLRMRMV